MPGLDDLDVNCLLHILSFSTARDDTAAYVRICSDARKRKGGPLRFVRKNLAPELGGEATQGGSGVSNKSKERELRQETWFFLIFKIFR